MKKQLLLLTLFVVLSTMLHAQKPLPKLLQGDGPQFAYQECVMIDKKKDQNCDRFEYTYKLANDTLYITLKEIAHVHSEKKKSERFTYYKVAVRDIYANESLARFSSEYREFEPVKDFDGKHNRVLSFSFYAVSSNIICSGWGYFGKVEKKNKITLRAEGYSDAKALLEYFK